MWIIFRTTVHVFLLLLLFNGYFCIRLVSIDVPTSVILGESFWLNCTIDLETDELYGIKWYKDDVEFYRYLPDDKPSYQWFIIPVDLTKSKEGHVFIKKADMESEGSYRCEASADAPSFRQVEEERLLKVYVPPLEGPKIEGIQAIYEIGDYVNATCKSAPSKPGADLKWYINGEEAHLDLEIFYPPINHDNGLQTSLLGLIFLVESRDQFQGGSITIKCMATVLQTHSMSSEEDIVVEKFMDTSSSTNTLNIAPTPSNLMPCTCASVCDQDKIKELQDRLNELKDKLNEMVIRLFQTSTEILDLINKPMV